jgi:hypothetical protein
LFFIVFHFFSQELVTRGCLQADDVGRMLVASVVQKADKMRRGHCARTSSSDLDIERLTELAFALGDRVFHAILSLSRFDLTCWFCLVLNSFSLALFD